MIRCDQLEQLAATVPVPAAMNGHSRPTGGAFDLDRWLEVHADRVHVARTSPWNGGTKWVLARCPWDAGHTNESAYIVRFGNGAIAAGCHHHSCAGRNWASLRSLVDAVSLATVSTSPWASAQAAAEFVQSNEQEHDFLEPKMLARGAITEVFSPRGIGKTLAVHALAVKLAKQGLRVLLVDRDNPRSTLRRRLQGWGAGVETPNLKIISREHAPPLTDRGAWAKFPCDQYDVVILDSLDAAAEGVGEKDSSKPSEAIAPLLDLAHREGGPAIIVLGNTIKSGAHSRGSGVIEDRADITYEVRDATNFMPSGRRPWYQELPAAGVDAWGERSVRRKGRKVYRLAFVASKFRIGEEPEPFLLEVDLTTEPWQLRDVTDAVVQGGQALRVQQETQRSATEDRAARALVDEIQGRAAQGKPTLADRDGVPFLQERYALDREDARQLIDQRDGRNWLIAIGPGRGQPKILRAIPLIEDRTGTISHTPIPNREPVE